MQASQLPGRGPEFRIVCINCDALGIAFDCAEDAPSWTKIRCRNCGAPRGTLGDLRNLAASDRQDLFDSLISSVHRLAAASWAARSARSENR